MKLVAVGDVHGRDTWKEIYEKERPDIFLFIGDYWDSFDIKWEQQVNNFLDIIELKKRNPKNVILIIGNHDFHYMAACLDAYEQYAGFQETYARAISFIMQESLPHMQIAYKHGDFLFTHAGVTATWVRNQTQLYKLDKPTISNIEEWLNDLFKYKPLAYGFVEGTNTYGDSKLSSPIWVRPRSLMANPFGLKELKQVVGHTGHDTLTIVKDLYYFIDTMGWSEQYLIIENDQVKIGEI